MNLYELLGVAVDASANDIKKAFIERIKQSHPDKTVGSHEDTSREVIRAYRTLADEGTRAEYDKRMLKDKGFKMGYVDSNPNIQDLDDEFVVLSCNQCETENKIKKRVLQDFDSYECMSCNYNVFLAD
jgi:curved DNA-binding protein CbpA